MVLSIVGDESADETGQRVFAVSGLFGTEAEWQAAEAAWTAVTGGEVFHAADWEHQGRHDEYKALVLALTGSPIAGVVYAIDLVAFHGCYPDTLRDTPYLKCLLKLVAHAAQTASVFNATHAARPISRLAFTFDDRRQSRFNAERLYGAIRSELGFAPAQLLAPTASFADRTNPRIQMADLIAREGMKDVDRNVGPVPFPERRSKIQLSKDGSFRFFVLGREDFEQERQQAAELGRADGFSEAAYHRWLMETRAQDTGDNRVRFLEHFNRQSGR